jgi:hypothetical protein
MLHLDTLDPAPRPVHPGWFSGQTVISPTCLITHTAPGCAPVKWPLDKRASPVKTKEFVEWRTLTDLLWARSIGEYISRQLRSLPLQVPVHIPLNNRKVARAGAE